jgi:Uma2 family endonuclease
MPAVEQAHLTPEQFEALYGGEKPYYEYWAGEPVQKAIPTWLHALIQQLLVRKFEDLGYQSGAEVTVRIDPAYWPIPDVIAIEGTMTEAYPTTAFEIVVEILSPEDTFSRVLRKCRLYANWGIQRILVIDPATRIVWSFEQGVLKETDLIARRGESALMANELWQDVDRRQSHR